jgi:hypothetical protein
VEGAARRRIAAVVGRGAGRHPGITAASALPGGG